MRRHCCSGKSIFLGWNNHVSPKIANVYAPPVSHMRRHVHRCSLVRGAPSPFVLTMA